MHCANCCGAGKRLEIPKRPEFKEIYKTIISFAPVGYEIGYNQLGDCLSSNHGKIFIYSRETEAKTEAVWIEAVFPYKTHHSTSFRRVHLKMATRCKFSNINYTNQRVYLYRYSGLGCL